MVGGGWWWVGGLTRETSFYGDLIACTILCFPFSFIEIGWIYFQLMILVPCAACLCKETRRVQKNPQNYSELRFGEVY